MADHGDGGTPPELVGRLRERAWIDGLLASAREGFGGGLVLEGPPGCGKSGLLDFAVRRAGADMLVLRATGVETEMAFAYSGLQRLLRPVQPDAVALPAPQRRALGTALGVRDGPPPNGFLVGLATLGVLSAAGATRPVLCVVDDLQWLDTESVEVLYFVVRRLLADSLSLLLATRERSPAPPPDIPTRRVPGLQLVEAAELMASKLAGPPDHRVLQELVQQTEGNPLALIECTQALTREQLAGREPLPPLLPIGPHLEPFYAAAAARLPPLTQRLLLTAAALGETPASALWEAGGRLGFGRPEAIPAEREGLILVAQDVTFRHPLVRSAVYYSAAEADRRRVHGVLAETTGHDRRRRAWHLAASSAAPDELVAQELEQAGSESLSQGALSAAAFFFSRAASMSATPPLASRRALKAARYLDATGSLDAADLLLETIGTVTDDRSRAELDLVRGRILFHRGQPVEAVAALVTAARSLALTDEAGARAVLLEALVQALTGSALGSGPLDAREVSLVVREVGIPAAGERSLQDWLLDAYATLLLEGLGAAAPILRRVVDDAVDDSSVPEDDDALRRLRAAGTAATFIADVPAQLQLSRRLESGARRTGDVESLYVSLASIGTIQVIAGRLGEADDTFAEMAAIDGTRGRSVSYGRLLVAAWRGHHDRTYELHHLVLTEAQRHEQAYQLPVAAWAMATLALAEGDWSTARVALAPYVSGRSSIKSSIADAVEAAVHTGDVDEALSAVEALRTVVQISGSPRLAGYLERCEALLAGDDAEAERHFEAAARLHREAGAPVDTARSELAYGEWLRRHRRRREARVRLRDAYDVFTRCGMDGFANRAAGELRLAGEAVVTVTAPARADLTTQERDIARMAAAGLPNQQIAGQLFLSPSTVDYHLRKVYRKLGISSRQQLTEGALGTS